MSSQHRVIIDGSGFSITGVEPRRVRWSEVLEVFAYKEDVFSFDIICLGFRTADDGVHLRVDEEFRGYQALLEELPLRFPGIREDWFKEVAFPAFATCRTTLWGESQPW